MTLHVVAHVTAKPDKIAAAKAMMQGLLEPTRKEAGCIKYVMLENNADPARFVFVEEWESEAALEAHLKAPHIAAAFERIPELLEGPPEIHRCALAG
jgi:quinol monooxygenase YgiN